MKRTKFKIPDKSQNRPAVPSVLKLMREYIQHGERSFHVFLDGNYTDSTLLYIMEQCSRHNDIPGVNITYKLLTMTQTQRRKISCLLYKRNNNAYKLD